ncbi:SLC26A/SulP transporter family protein [Allocoleopsis sp.]|uniref:SLC26A/SulP transporter family protein n=1 Tax=Allocoleopsis sp. TaxID=3088169 RepID=UPI002FD4410F
MQLPGIKPFAWFQQEFHPTRLLPSLMAGLVVGVLAVTNSVSFAALIFSGNLSHYLPTAIGITLFTAAVVGAIAALISSYPGTFAGPQDTTAAVLALVASTITTTLSATASAEETLLTVVGAIVFNALVTGLFFLVVGHFRLGELIRFIPYPVIGGFLAGSGWLLVLGAIGLMTNLSLQFSQLGQLFEPEQLLKWLPGLVFAVLLLVILQFYHHALILPGMLLGAIAIFYLVLLFTDTSVAQASARGLLLGPFPEGGMLKPLSLSALPGANWLTIFRQIPHLATIWIIDIIALLLSVNGIELATGRDINLNHELKTAGIATLVSSLGGGMGGFHGLSESSLAYSMGATSRLVGLFSATVCAVMLMLGASVLSFFPKPIVGGMLLFLGLELLVEWVYWAWFKLPLADYCLIILIVFVIAAVGFLPGVSVGIIAAVILFAINYSRISVTKNTFSGANHTSHVQRPINQSRLLRDKGEQIYVLQLQGLIFFGTANKLLNQIRQRLGDPNLQPLRFVVLDFRLVSGLDSSAVVSFVKLKQMAGQRQISLVFTHLPRVLEKQLRQGGAWDTENAIYQVFPDLDRGLEWCENQILETSKLRRRRFVPLALQLKSIFPAPDLISQLMKYLELLKIPEGDLLFRQGEPSNGLYFLESGQLSVVLELSNGQTKRLQTYNSGTILGEMGLYANAPRSASVVADQSSRLYYLSTQAFERIEIEQPQLAIAFHKFIVNLLAERLKLRQAELQNLLQ